MRNLLRWPLLGAVFAHPWLLNAVRLLVLALFVSAIAFGLSYPDKASNPYTAAIFWSLFWPFFR